MELKCCIAAVAAAVNGLVFAETAAAPDWENLAVNSRNRLPARTYAMPLASEQAALTDALEPETPYKKSLNGDWKIKWVGDPARRPTDFFRTDYDDSDWNTIDVPSCVEMRGYGTPGYVNVKYPHANAWPKILDRQTNRADYNPVSSYRTTFTVPENWQGRDVILRFDGVYSAYYVWVNGKLVGYAEDSKLPSEFNITPYLKKGQGEGSRSTAEENLLAVQVFRWCDGSYLEDQDMFRFSGIFRDVTLWAKPKDGIEDIVVKTQALDASYENWLLDVEVKVKGEGEQRISASLFDADKKKVCDLLCSSTPTSSPSTSPLTFASTLAARAWSAEDPYLYTLVIRKGDDIRMKRVGFKEQKIVGNRFLVNGKPVKFKGVNRHETNPDNGRTVSLKDMTDDILLMKRFNINTVRTSHYPNHHLWYDLCDRYGIYLIAEANVEGHEPGYDEKGLGRFPEFDHAIVERNVRHAEFYRNNVSVTMWSMGNETGHGDCFRHAIAEVRKTDPSRPIHWERGNADADIDSTMYPSVYWLEKRGKLGNLTTGAKLEGEGGGEGYAISGHTAGKAHIMCEYAHAMGNAIGNFQEYWDIIYRYPALTGGCIWDWIDQAIWKEMDRVDPKTGKRERFLAYGGDYDEEPHDGPFCVNGVIDPLRTVTPKLREVGHVYRDLVVTRAEDSTLEQPIFELENRYLFTAADRFVGGWELFADGKPVAEGGFLPPAVGPLSRGRFTIPELAATLAKVAEGAECVLAVSFVLPADTRWAKRGHAVSRNEIALTAPRAPTAAIAATAGEGVQVVEDARRLTVTVGTTRAVFDRASGTLAQLTFDEAEVLADLPKGLVAGPQLTCLRAATDNDHWMFSDETWNGVFYQGCRSSGLFQLRYHPAKFVVEGNQVRVTVDVAGAKGCGFTHESVYTFAADGALDVANTVTPYGKFPGTLPRLGLTLRLAPCLERMRWYGRGPWENYVDRCRSSFLGVYSSTVTEQFVDYVRPQDNGMKSDVRWVEFTDTTGHGVRFSASEPLFVQALHYTMEDLEFARPARRTPRRFRTPLVPHEEVILNLDVRQTGLGNGSCGPGPTDEYRYKPTEPVAWRIRLEPVK